MDHFHTPHAPDLSECAPHWRRSGSLPMPTQRKSTLARPRWNQPRWAIEEIRATSHSGDPALLLWPLETLNSSPLVEPALCPRPLRFWNSRCFVVRPIIPNHISRFNLCRARLRLLLNLLRYHNRYLTSWPHIFWYNELLKCQFRFDSRGYLRRNFPKQKSQISSKDSLRIKISKLIKHECLRV